MSTKAIREVLDWVENYLGNEPDAQEVRRAARAELSAIEKAARELDRLHIGDFVYNIRDRGATLNWASKTGQSPWESPDVKAWNDAAALLERIAKEAE